MQQIHGQVKCFSCQVGSKIFSHHVTPQIVRGLNCVYVCVIIVSFSILLGLACPYVFLLSSSWKCAFLLEIYEVSISLDLFRSLTHIFWMWRSLAFVSKEMDLSLCSPVGLNIVRLFTKSLI